MVFGEWRPGRTKAREGRGSRDRSTGISGVLKDMRAYQLSFLCLFIVVFGFFEPDRTCAETRTYTDALGRVVTFSYPPKRIVSLVPDITETLFVLGLADEIVGVTRFSDYPPTAREKPKVGSYTNINTEAVIGLKPDLILGSGAGNSPRQVRRLARLGFPVFVVYPKDLDGVLEAIEQIAEVVGKAERGEVIVRDMRHRMGEISRRVAGRVRPKVLLQIGRDPIFTVSKGSFAHHLISLAGGDNIAKDAKLPYPSYSLEEIILRGPEVIIVSSMYVDSNHAQWLKEWKEWTILPAVKNNRLYAINSDLIDRPSPRIVKGLEAMARMIHPEAFAGDSR